MEGEAGMAAATARRGGDGARWRGKKLRKREVARVLQKLIKTPAKRCPGGHPRTTLCYTHALCKGAIVLGT